MGLNLKDYLVVGISSRALFDLDEENRIYEEQGLAAYSEYQIAHEDEVLAPGSGFALVKALLNLNTISDKRYVEVIIMSRNSADTSLRIFHSIEHYGLDISRAVLSGGSSLSNYLEAFDVDLFLSADSHDVEQAINSGFAAGRIYTDPILNYDPKHQIDQIRIAFDGDAVLFSDDSEKIYQQKGLSAFVQNEKENARNNLNKGPFAQFLKPFLICRKILMKQIHRFVQHWLRLVMHLLTNGSFVHCVLGMYALMKLFSLVELPRKMY